MSLRLAISAAADALEANVDELRRLDAIVGDGDLGVTAAKVAKSMREALSAVEVSNSELLVNCGKTISLTAASSCGTLLAGAFLSSGKSIGDESIQIEIAKGLNAALESVIKRGKANRGDRTLIDVVGPAADAASKNVHLESLADYLDEILIATNEGLVATKDMVPKIGRARSKPNLALGHVDAGAALVAIALSAAIHSTFEKDQ
jgi:dihydroxyacetone kinase